MKIKDMSEGERPRFRMASLGPGALSDSELLAILLRTGNSGESVVELARRLLSEADGSLSQLFRMSADRLRRIKGIGECKAVTIQAALELGRRFYNEDYVTSRKPLVSARMAYDMMRPVFKGIDHEECWVLFLNSHNYPTSRSRISSGGGNSTVIDVNRIVRMSLDKAASGIILMHNHPGGDPNPSEADIRQTDSLHTACNAVQISLIDHIVVADDSFYSFSDSRMYFK